MYMDLQANWVECRATEFLELGSRDPIPNSAIGFVNPQIRVFFFFCFYETTKTHRNKQVKVMNEAIKQRLKGKKKRKEEAITKGSEPSSAIIVWISIRGLSIGLRCATHDKKNHKQWLKKWHQDNKVKENKQI